MLFLVYGDYGKFLKRRFRSMGVMGTSIRVVSRLCGYGNFFSRRFRSTGVMEISCKAGSGL